MKKCLDCGKNKSKKGLYCKSCGYKHRIRPKGLQYKFVKENKGRFKKGQEAINPFEKGHKPWNKNKVGVMPFGENHIDWKGEEAKYNTKHTWVYKWFGKAKKCSRNILHKAKNNRFHWHNISGEYKRERQDWEELCPSCHKLEHSYGKLSK